jgi:hypothetical protein
MKMTPAFLALCFALCGAAPAPAQTHTDTKYTVTKIPQQAGAIAYAAENMNNLAQIVANTTMKAGNLPYPGVLLCGRLAR